MATIHLTAPIEGWLSSLDTVPDAVFATLMLGDGVAIDPIGDCLHAPCDGIVTSLQPSGHAVVIAGPEGVEVLMHVGLDTVALGGLGFAPCVAVGDAVKGGDPLIRLDLDLLVREARAVVTPVIVTNLDRFEIVAREDDRLVGVGDALMTLVPRTASATASAPRSGGSHDRLIAVPLAHGIHARPAARIGEIARQFESDIVIAKGARHANVRSPIGLLALGIGFRDDIVVSATGVDAEQALAAVCDLILGGMGEAEAAPRPAPVPVATVPLADGMLAGVTASPGRAIGQARRFRLAELGVEERGQGVEIEHHRLDEALATVAARLAGAMATASGPEYAIIVAHTAMLEDSALRDAAHARIAGGASAGHGWRQATRPQAEALKATGDARLAERADDILDLERRVLGALAGVEDAPVAFAPGTILLADDLLPSHVMALDTANVVGFCVERGGPTSHVAILAATMGLPAIVAVGPALGEIVDGTTLILDAGAGTLHVDPDADSLAKAQEQLSADHVRRASARANAAQHCRTRDGVRIEAFANLGSIDDAHVAVANGAEGCGLLRTEFLFLERDTAPDIAEQTADYQRIADTLEGRPLIVRLLDIGGDKPAPYLPIAAEENPALGLRGVRVGLAHTDLLDAQLRAILSVRPAGQCRIMVPMVASLAELRAVRTALERAHAAVGGDTLPALGIMVETPAAAATADLLAREADFLSIGTNDLTQYVLAMDRGNAAVAHGVDGLHPAVLRLIAQTVRGGERHARWTGVCGGLASDPLAIPILLGLGVTELSSAPAFVPEVKALVGTLDLTACRAHAAAALDCESAAQVRALAREFHA